MKGILGSVLLLTVVVAVASFPQQEEYSSHLDSHWEVYKSIYQKTYSSDDEVALRRFIWESNLKFIKRHNLEYEAGLHSYTVGMNQFGDLTNDEYRAKLLAPDVPPYAQPKWSKSEVADTPNPEDEIDWRKNGWVTEVKDQATCKCGWSFAASGALEAQYANVTKKLVRLSEQQMIDCSRGYGTRGCSGGEITQAFDYIRAYGLESEVDYRYRADDKENCQYDYKKVVTRCNRFIPIPQSEYRLHEDLVAFGPIAVTIDASLPSFKFYKSGIYDEPFCSKTNLNHGVLVVGCGRAQRDDYWIVKNSYGPGWGMDGYIYMSKGKYNQCGIASRASVCLI